MAKNQSMVVQRFLVASPHAVEAREVYYFAAPSPAPAFLSPSENEEQKTMMENRVVAAAAGLAVLPAMTLLPLVVFLPRKA